MFYGESAKCTTPPSKHAVNHLGDGGPYGHYHGVKDWLSNQRNLFLIEKMTDAIFDNNQEIVGSSVVTTICQIEYPSYNLERR